jgi:hypothetical protein
MTQRVGAFTPETAAEILRMVDYFRQSGYRLPAGRGADQRIGPTTPILVRNTSGEEIPPYACMQSVGTHESGGQNYVDVDKPSDIYGEQGTYLFNNEHAIPTGATVYYGVGHPGPVCRMLTDGSTTTANALVRAQVDSWELTEGGGTFRIVGTDDIATDVIWGRFIEPPQAVIVYTDAQIGARSGSTLGSGTVSIYEYDSLTLTDTGVNITAYNLSTTPIPASCYYLARRIRDTGPYIIDPPSVTDLQLDGTDLELRRNCGWEVWHAGEACT